MEVVGCEIYGNHDNEIYLLYGTDAIISGNLCHDTVNGNGISVQASASVTNNHCYNNAIGISAIGLVGVLGNECNNNGVGIATSGGSAQTVGNRSYLNGTGLQLSGGNASRNVIYSNAGDGIVASGSLLVQNNLVYANGGFNVHLSGPGSMAVLNNTLCGGNGLFADNQGDPYQTVSNRNNIIWAAGNGRVALTVGNPPPSTAIIMTCMPLTEPPSVIGWAIARHSLRGRR